jgi:hypothetical protein
MLVEELSLHTNVYVDCKKTPLKFAKNLVGDNPHIFDSFNKFGVSLKSGNLFKWIRFLRNKQVGIYVTSPGPVSDSAPNAVKAYFLIVHLFLKNLGVKSYRIGKCCSQFIAEEKTVRNSRHEASFFRSKSSVSFLKEHGITRVSYIPDLAFLLNQYVSPKEKTKTVLMCFREIKGKSDLFISWLREVINLLVHNCFNIEFYYQVEIDKEFNEKLYNIFKSEYVSFHSDLIWYEDLDYYADKMIVISNRLHSLIVGAVYGVLPLAYVNLDSKVRKISDVLESTFISYNQIITNGNDIQQVKKMIENYSVISASVYQDVQHNCQLCKKTIASLFE